MIRLCKPIRCDDLWKISCISNRDDYMLQSTDLCDFTCNVAVTSVRCIRGHAGIHVDHNVQAFMFNE